MTFLEIQKMVELKARYRIEPDTIKTLINTKLKMLVGKFDLPMYQSVSDLETIDEQYYYDLDETVRKLSDLRTKVNDITDQTTLFAQTTSSTIPFREIYDKSKAIDSGVNKSGHVIELYSNPGLRTVALENNLELYYYRHPIVLVENNDIPEFPDQYHELISLAAAVELHDTKFGNSPLQGKYDEMYAAFCSEMQKEPDADFPDHDIMYAKEYL